MNKEQIIKAGREIEKIADLPELCEKYEAWKADLLNYAVENKLNVEQYRILLHVVKTPYGSQEENKENYISCIKKTILYLEKDEKTEKREMDALETIIKNFGLYLQNMFSTTPENQATLKKEVLEQIILNNEYDVQHTMYAVVKALYPTARREVNQDIGYGAVRYDIIVDEIDTVIEIKCTRKDHSENKLFRELGEDAFFYQCSKLIIYVYDKEHVIQDINNFIRALERSKEDAGKDIKVYVEQIKELI